MIKNQKLRFGIIFLAFVFSVIWIFPNFVSVDEKNWWFTKEKIIYGLDIQGGLHLVLGAKVEKALSEKINRFIRRLEIDLKSKNVPFKRVSQLENTVTGSMTWIAIEVEKKSEIEKIRNFFKKDDSSYFLNNSRYGGLLEEFETKGKEIIFHYNEAEVLFYKKQMIDQVIQVIRNRIDEFGVLEPVIAAQGENRVLVQLPGIEDATQAKKLLSQTGRLVFRGVLEDISQTSLLQMVSDAELKGQYSLGTKGLRYGKYIQRLNKDLKEKLPSNTMVIFEKNPNALSLEAGKVPYLIETLSDLSGDMLDSANVGVDERGMPVVHLRFGVEGRNKFSEMTEKRKNERIAIILDHVVHSAPVVRERIRDGSAQISLGAMNYNEALKEANFIASTLNAGALPVELELLEEKTVGPTLGADSIRKGKQAGIIAFILVLIFMFTYYGFLGFISNIALMLNLLFILALLSSLGATLTLPGVAGIVLTIGVAVDANVIIFERIKEELRKGSGKKLAIQNGFAQALSSIFDANITTAAVCLILIYFGTGPIRGFAVTLIIGIVTSLFTAVFVSRTLIEFSLLRFKNLKLFLRS